MPKLKDYYEVLGIPRRSHVRVIEERYWEQAHELKKQPTRKAQRRLSALNEAYETLGTPHRRLKYDQELSGYAEESAVRGGGGVLRAVFSVLGKPFRPD